MSKKFRATVGDLLYYVVGCTLNAIAVSMFIVPNEITPGGVTGIATILHHLFLLPSGLLVLLLNIPILFLGLRRFGVVFIAKTAVVTVLFSLALDVSEALLPPVSTDRFLSAVFGGLMMGTGLGLVMLRGATTGGVDILAKLLADRFRHLTVGRLILLMDAAVIALAALVYRDVESALYSVVSLYASSNIMDKILYGGESGKLIYIIGNRSREICAAVGSRLNRGVTTLEAKGGYTGKSRTLILCTVRRHEVAAVHSIVKECDPAAFIVVADVGEIIGEGFKSKG